MDEARSSMAGISLSNGDLEERISFTNNNRVEFLKENIENRNSSNQNKKCKLGNTVICQRLYFDMSTNNGLYWIGLKLKH